MLHHHGSTVLPGNVNYSPRRKGSSVSEAWSDDRLKIGLGILGILVPWAPYFLSILPHLNYVRNDIARMQADQKRMLADLQKTTKKVQKINAEASTLEEENNALLFDLRDHGDNVDTETNRYREGEDMEEMLIKKIDFLQGAIQKRSEQAVKEAFGEGPFRVKITLESEPVNEFFIMETAPLSIMPHAVYHFMKMVSNNLWDGLSMVSRSSEPILQATPLDASTNTWADKRFEDANVTHMAFTEYSFDYPPKKYTLAFAGRPGGPDFYVNMEELQDESEEGESCFGIVVEGFDVLDRFMARTGRWKKHHQVAIVSIDILADYDSDVASEALSDNLASASEAIESDIAKFEALRGSDHEEEALSDDSDEESKVQ